ncbi:DedA family protein [Paenactinomyces guangxiensis]|uniref:DedA family protein n=1 Tax=Paenactinomyces guangxiensis TaxID=1490290 RepID=A0A7W1WNW0_9BACL|nr:DedA family protein [Paenactinomyces guangxiensis]MBA4493199.1 DedA family protein [Paenactinomyces guangxiensis]MBH8589951.1 DedA family protein [Paenactinomyces guangxiensis]
MEQSLIDLLQEYGYLGIFLFLVLGIVGLPLPDEIMMTFIGYLTSIGQLNLALTYLSALAGSACGITISYMLGTKLGYPFLRKYGNKIFITRRRLRITQVLFRKYGNWLLFVGYFIPGVRHVTAYLAGISKLPYSRFSLFAYSGAMVWCATFIGLGHILGANWETVFEVMHKYGARLLLIALPIIGIAVGLYYWNQSQSKSLDTK